jgi:hypothetical protein
MVGIHQKASSKWLFGFVAFCENDSKTTRANQYRSEPTVKQVTGNAYPAKSIEPKFDNPVRGMVT